MRVPLGVYSLPCCAPAVGLRAGSAQNRLVSYPEGHFTTAACVVGRAHSALLSSWTQTVVTSSVRDCRPSPLSTLNPASCGWRQPVSTHPKATFLYTLGCDLAALETPCLSAKIPDRIPSPPTFLVSAPTSSSLSRVCCAPGLTPDTRWSLRASEALQLVHCASLASPHSRDVPS